ncbi:hypothetical protein PGT21_033380 [Puccinia graminis f. sp. tritici]|uniref:Uncharacterized protein n=2 Tax=Puccinia graminis f. sp. tritici TaxID=56615 RepID=A0A5B0N940_PUCGR|nr:hypothetical protein PGTUg99_003384 [Puccinia graminis f. sp. tritici]KAA1084640.1 hypothetical protein PGT21_033380 [Puccinia graminis f. sp. tritici]
MVQFVKTCHPVAFLSIIAMLLGPSVAYSMGGWGWYWDFFNRLPTCPIDPCPPRPPSQQPPPPVPPPLGLSAPAPPGP